MSPKEAPVALWRHLRSLWPKWTLLPPAPFFLWGLYWLLRGEVRWEHIALMTVPAALAYFNATSKRLFLGLAPMGFVAVFYDAMRFVKNTGLTASGVHNCDLRRIEMSLFGIEMDGRLTTVHDWLQANAVTALDVICALPYGIFIYAAVFYAIFLYIKDFQAQQRFTWSFLLLNIAGFATYHIYPAAPPWYYHAHGCEVDLLSPSSPGANLIRVDALLGFPYFASFYGRASDVFGAIPSLHVSYPLLMLLEGWKRHRAFGRTMLCLFAATMNFAAVYLDHHWIIDIIIGNAYGLVAFFGMRALWRYAAERDLILGVAGQTKEASA
jgi:hypothetical protein